MYDVINKFIPPNPQVSLVPATDEEPVRVCLDLASETILQNQRQFAYLIGGPAVLLAGMKLSKKEPLFGAFVSVLGVACTWWHYQAHRKVNYLTGIQ